jgi:formylglycine-generating enzyme required for sulfatase activity
MDFQQTWRKQIQERLARFAASARAQFQQAAPNLLYGFLSAMALWPVAQAVQGGELAALLALGSVAGGVGANLIANQVQSWRDEADAAEQLSQAAQDDPDVREALDALLDELGVVEQAQAGMSDQDRAWFLETLRREVAQLGSSLTVVTVTGPGAAAVGDHAVVGGADSTVVGRDVDGDVVTVRDVSAEGDVTGRDKTVIVATEGSTVIIGEPPVETPAVDPKTALGRYLRHVISRNRYLQLQGIRSGGRLVHIELEQIYVTLRATRQRTVEAEEAWLEAEAGLAPGEARLRPEIPRVQTETVTVSVDEALAAHPRLAVLGDPGSGKTTLLRYLALLYARDLAEGTALVQERLNLDEGGRLPILLPLRRLGAYLKAHHPVDDGTEGHGLLLDHLRRVLEGERVSLPGGFFDPYLEKGQAVILLDGLDEVADPNLRRRVSRLVEAFTAAYPDCRYVVSSRLVGYTGPARLGQEYVTTTIRDFTMADVERFLRNWHLAVAVGQMGPGESAAAYAEGQTLQLLAAIDKNERIRELAINPLMLTVIALVHRDRVKLPDRRAELYDEAVNVLLGKWEEAKGVPEMPILEDRPFDAGDRRLTLQAVALWMQEQQQKEIEAGNLRQLLGETFQGVVSDGRAVSRAVGRFLLVIQERTGLLGEHGLGVYRFSHLTFQEYLAALAVAGRDDYVAYTMERVGDPWWREVILLEAGHLSTQSRERTAKLIRAIADRKEEPEPYHNLVLAAECLRDVGPGRVEGNLWSEVQRRIRRDVDRGPTFFVAKFVGQLRATPVFSQIYGHIRPHLPKGLYKGIIRTIGVAGSRRSAAARALARIGGAYWTEPYGEPEWIEIPAGEFWMGSDKEYGWEKPVHRVYVERFQIARVPVTNAQYQFFVKTTGHQTPEHWGDSRPPRGLESHPVVNVSWHDALTYCRWLSEVTGKPITLPSEAQWEKAARGDKDRREYPWGDKWDESRCNNIELGLGDTTPVGIFPEGTSPYGCLDMAGNVWEWTRSLCGKDFEPAYLYPYDPSDGRENLEGGDDVLRVVRGGAFTGRRTLVRCASRLGLNPLNPWFNSGFRVVLVAPGFPSGL